MNIEEPPGCFVFAVGYVFVGVLISAFGLR